jgi:Rieske Fe-S protein
MTDTHETAATDSTSPQASTGPTVSRRRVIAVGGALGAAGVVAACGGGGGGADATDTPAPTTPGSPDPTSTTSTVPGDALAPVSDIPVGGGRVFDGPKIVVTQPSPGDIQAFTAVCPHQGCLVTEVVDNEILCPCHGSLFSAENGDVIRGPAVQGLAGASVGIVDGFIVTG